MTKVSEFTSAAQAQVLEGIELTQQAVLSGMKTWVETVEKFVPQIPSTPFVAEMPAARETIEKSFDFAQRILTMQRDFAKDVLAVAAPVFDRAKKTTVKPADK